MKSKSFSPAVTSDAFELLRDARVRYISCMSSLNLYARHAEKKDASEDYREKFAALIPDQKKLVEKSLDDCEEALKAMTASLKVARKELAALK